MTDAEWYVINTISKAQPSNDPALFDSGTRASYERGFAQMRAIAKAAALNAVTMRQSSAFSSTGED